MHLARHCAGCRSIGILRAALFDKLDALTDLVTAAADAVAAVNYFVTFALRNAALIGED